MRRSENEAPASAAGLAAGIERWLPTLTGRLWATLARRREALVMALAVLARLPGLWNKPLWYDEAFAVLFSSTGPKAMAYGTLAVQAGVAADVHPLGYYTLLWAWTSMLGTSPIVLRSLSLLLGVATVYLGMRLAEELFGSRSAAAAGLLLALGPFPVHYAQEVRMYALMALLLLAATWAYHRALLGGTAQAWASFAVLAAMAQYTHALSATYLAALAATSLWRRDRRALRNTALAGLGALLLYLPWLLYLPSQISRLRWAYWVQRPGLAELVQTWLVFVGGLPLFPWVLVLGLIGTVLATALAVLGTVRAWRAGDPRAGRAAWCLYLAALPPALMFAFSYWQPVYLERALLASGLCFLLWMGWGVTRPQLGALYRRTAAAALATAFFAGLLGTYTYRGYPYAPFAQLAWTLRGGSERVVHSNKLSALPVAYYDRGRAPTYLADPPGSGSDTLALATQQVLGLLAEPDIETAAAGADRIALVVFDRELQDYRSLGFAEHPALKWLGDNYDRAGTEAFGELRVYHFER